MANYVGRWKVKGKVGRRSLSRWSHTLAWLSIWLGLLWCCTAVLSRVVYGMWHLWFATMLGLVYSGTGFCFHPRYVVVFVCLYVPICGGWGQGYPSFIQRQHCTSSNRIGKSRLCGREFVFVLMSELALENIRVFSAFFICVGLFVGFCWCSCIWNG